MHILIHQIQILFGICTKLLRLLKHIINNSDVLNGGLLISSSEIDRKTFKIPGSIFLSGFAPKVFLFHVQSLDQAGTTSQRMGAYNEN